MFDMIETVDSLKIAEEISKRAIQAGKTMNVLIEINSGREKQKSGVMPEDAVDLIKNISLLPGIAVKGLMTMGALMGEPDDFKPYFKTTKELFNTVKSLGVANVEMKWLSMGMTDSYRVAIEEGANMVRIGTKIFGARRQ